MNTSSHYQIIFGDFRLRRRLKTNKASGEKARLGHQPWRICSQISNCLM